MDTSGSIHSKFREFKICQRLAQLSKEPDIFILLCLLSDFLRSVPRRKSYTSSNR